MRDLRHYVLSIAAFGSTLEDPSEKEIAKMVKTIGLVDKTSGARLFGRNIYATDKPETHGN